MSHDSYTPQQIGIAKDFRLSVSYAEQPPILSLKGIVYCYWTLHTTKPLNNDFSYTVMPDACIDIIFDIVNRTEPIIMTPSVSIETIRLGKKFHYAGIRLHPGTLGKSVDMDQVVSFQKQANDVIRDGINWADATEKVTSNPNHYTALEDIAYSMLTANVIQRNALVENVIRGLQYGLSVDEIAKKVGYSPRQLRRIITKQTGFSPVHLMRILRFQSVISSNDALGRFADQSHLIREFKAITGTSYKAFINPFK